MYRGKMTKIAFFKSQFLILKHCPNIVTYCLLAEKAMVKKSGLKNEQVFLANFSWVSVFTAPTVVGGNLPQ